VTAPAPAVKKAVEPVPVAGVLSCQLPTALQSPPSGAVHVPLAAKREQAAKFVITRKTTLKLFTVELLSQQRNNEIK